MARGLALPIVAGRGAGLGNEMVVWGKAYVAGQTLGLRVLTPAFGLNARGYAHYFGTSSYDWVLHRVLRTALPGAIFTEADFRAREDLGFAAAVKSFVMDRRLGRLPYYVLGIEGLWGGFAAIGGAKEFLRSKLLSSRGTLENLFALDRQVPDGTVTVGIHVRRGDFIPSKWDGDFRSKFNVSIPLEWYVEIARSLRHKLGGRVSFIVVSDAPADELRPLGNEIPCLFTDAQKNRDISDLLALAACDLVVCSVSTYSAWAAFLTHGRYLWFAPNLSAENGLASIWGHEFAQQSPRGQTSLSRDDVAGFIKTGERLTPKGLAVDWNGVIPDELFEFLETRARLARRQTDLVRYGVVNRE